MIEGSGIAVDHVISDFISGRQKDRDRPRAVSTLSIEGQGTIVHPAYSGVTLRFIAGFSSAGSYLMPSACTKDTTSF